MLYTSFTKELVQRRLAELVSMEEFYTPRESERWNAENFLKELPKKWALSQVCINNGVIVGYYIGSEKKENEETFGFVHRNFVVPDLRRSSVLVRLTMKGLEAARKEGLKQVRWYCSPKNTRVYEWHKNGFADGIIGSKTDNGTRYDLFYKNI